MRAGSPSAAGASGPAADGASVEARVANARFFALQARSKLLEALDLDQAASASCARLGLPYKRLRIEAGGVAGGLLTEPEAEEGPAEAPNEAPRTPARIYVALDVPNGVLPGIYSADGGGLNSRVWEIAGGQGRITAGNWKRFPSCTAALQYWQARHQAFGLARDPTFLTEADLP